MSDSISTIPEFTPEQLRERAQAKRRAIIGKILHNIVYFLIYALIAFVFVMPLLYVVGNSVRTSQAIWSNVFPASWKSFIPFEGVSFKNYIQALGLDVVSRGAGMDLSNALWISFASSVCVVACSLLFNTGAAYFFGRLRFPKKNWILVYVVATMMIPQQVVLVPLYFVVKQLGLINTFWAMVVPWYASPFIVFALTQFMSDLPYELDEAAIIDGANLFQILWKVVLPNSLPGLLTVSILEFQFIWNEFYWPLIAVSDQSLYPIQVAIAGQFTQEGPQWGRVFAAMVIASLPIIILFVSLQRYFYESVAMSGIKG